MRTLSLPNVSYLRLSLAVGRWCVQASCAMVVASGLRRALPYQWQVANYDESQSIVALLVLTFAEYSARSCHLGLDTAGES